MQAGRAWGILGAMMSDPAGSSRLDTHVRRAIARVCPEAAARAVGLGLLVEDGVPSALDIGPDLVDDLTEHLRSRLDRPHPHGLLLRVVPDGLDADRCFRIRFEIGDGGRVEDRLERTFALVRGRPSAEREPPPCEDLTIWVIDDEPVARRLIGHMLEALGAHVESFSRGNEALAAWASHPKAPPDLVFLDMSMPGLDGLATARRLRSEGLRAPIIGASANCLAAERRACIQAGMNDYLAKPVRPDTLADMLTTWGRCGSGARG